MKRSNNNRTGRTREGTVLLLLVLFVVSACAGLPGRPSSSKKVSVLPGMRHEVIESLRERNEWIRGLRMFATVQYRSRLVGSRSEAAIVLKRPYFLRIDQISPLGLSENQLVASRGDLIVYWPKENLYFKGLATHEQLARYLLVSLSPELVIQLLSGGVPLEDEEDYVLKVRSVRSEGREVHLKGRSSELLVLQRGSSYLPLRYILFDLDGSRNYVVDFSDYTAQGGGWFPNRLSGRFHDPPSRVEIRYHGVEVNPEIDMDLFQLKIPADASPIDP